VLSSKVLRCKDSPAFPAYNYAADLLGANIRAISASNGVDCLLCADGAVARATNTTNGLIVTSADVATSLHGVRPTTGFIAAFLDGHAAFISGEDATLNDAPELANIPSVSGTSPRVTLADTPVLRTETSLAIAPAKNAIVYQGAQHIFTYDGGEATGVATLTGSPVTGAVGQTMYITIYMSDLLAQEAPEFYPVVNLTQTVANKTVMIKTSAVKFGELSSATSNYYYYTFAVTPGLMAGVAGEINGGTSHTVTASASGLTLTVNIN
jgi:hypothetical protein